MHPAASLAVCHEGGLAFERVGGVVDTRTGAPASPGTLFVGFSCGKPLAAACLWVLHDRGHVGWDDPIAIHWPEFAGSKGKERVTVRHVLTHQAGLPSMPAHIPNHRYGEWNTIVEALEAAELEFQPGAAIAYHELTYGWLVGELVHRISGVAFRDFFINHVTVPLGLVDTYFGIPPELEPRVARLEAMPDVERPEAADQLNFPLAHQVVMPALNVITTARDLARFYAVLLSGGETGDTRWLSESTVAEATRAHAEGVDSLSGEPVRFGLGVSLASDEVGKFGVNRNRRAFGHGGFATSMAWADPDLELSFAYLTTGMQPAEVDAARIATISRAVTDAIEGLR